MPYDKLKAEMVGYANQYVERCRYVFENDKDVACYMEIESDNELFLQTLPFSDELEKMFIMKEIKKYYELSDEYFEQKCKGCSKAEIIISF